MERPDQIEREVTLRAPIERVWKAVTNLGEFEHWFGIRLAEPLEVGRTVKGVVIGSRPNDAELAESSDLKDAAPASLLCTAVNIEYPHHLRFRWTLAADNHAEGGNTQSAATIEIRLRPCENGTILTMQETGLASFPEAMRCQVLMMSTSARHGLVLS